MVMRSAFSHGPDHVQSVRPRVSGPECLALSNNSHRVRRVVDRAAEVEFDVLFRGSDPLDDEAVCHLELFVVDEPADAFQDCALRFEGRGVAQ
jgi:hypothetical protein